MEKQLARVKVWYGKNNEEVLEIWVLPLYETLEEVVQKIAKPYRKCDVLVYTYSEESSATFNRPIWGLASTWRKEVGGKLELQ